MVYGYGMGSSGLDDHLGAVNLMLRLRAVRITKSSIKTDER